ncbi:MAG: polysaccharide lyase 8 family protein, partial [Kiritimatiellia bacterium]
GLRGNPQLLKDIIEAMEVFLTNRWTPETKWDVNWWDFEIGVPRHIFNAMALISPHTPEHVKEMAFASMDRFQLIPTKFYNNAFNASGANLVWNISNHIASEALRESAEGLERCKDALPQVMRWVDEDPALLEGALDGTRKGKGPTVDGFWKDGSYIQHGHLPYIGAYGCLLISDLIQSVAVLNDTPWEVTDPSVNNIGKWVDKHFLTVGYEGELFPRTIGRAAGSKGIENANEWLIIALAEISTILPREKAVEVGAYLKRWYTRDGVDPDFTRASFTQFMKLYTIFENDAIAPAGPFIASNTFGAIDMATHHRPDWAATVAMSSTRIHSHESIWGANLKGWNMGEGVLYVYPSDPMRYRGGWMALVDPTRLPGITTNTWEFEPAGFGGANPKICKPSNQAFVGGASINNLASVSAMTVGRDYSSLQARKGWFFFPDSIVCLGSGITASDGRATETIIENCKRTAETQTLTANGEKVELSENKALLPPVSTLHLTGEEPGQSIGWWFPSPAKNITVTGGTRSGAWKDIAKGSSEDIMSHPWLTLVAEHGMDPQNASYQYVILPSVSESELQTFAKSGNISIHSNTEKIQAVRDNKNQITAIIFYEPGEIAGVKADQPCIVILQNTPSSYDLAVVDPTHKLKEMKIELALNTHLQPESNERVSAVFDKTKFLITINSANTFGDETVLTWKK